MGFLNNFIKPWLKRNYTKKLFFMKLDHIISHLYRNDRIKMEEKGVWQEKKTIAVIRQLEAGKNPLKFEPIRLVLHNFREEFRVDDGISRLRAFRREKIKIIKIEVRVGEW